GSSAGMPLSKQPGLPSRKPVGSRLTASRLPVHNSTQIKKFDPVPTGKNGSVHLLPITHCRLSVSHESRLNCPESSICPASALSAAAADTLAHDAAVPSIAVFDTNRMFI